MPRYIKDSTMSNYINGLKNGTRYRESGLVHGHICDAQRLSPMSEKQTHRKLSDNVRLGQFSTQSGHLS
jgi:hypothetical protein